MGEGAVETGWSGVLLSGDDLLDFSGDQGDASCSYVDLLQQWTGAPLV
ncbi:MAG: hypothetical protein ACLFVU_12545 [Phycisphaerae bacterium]